MNESVSSAWHWCRRYITFPLVVAVGYILFVLFFNENSYSQSARLQTEIERLTAEIKENNDTLAYYVRLNRLLDSDPSTLERIVREQYHMQRADEDVYIIE
ncbi:MAG: septum formation initiator family protein [Muribaculaceae bacterium]|nr:septum formation initiator family protein [Muribaculaceae bacterium]